MLLKKTQRPELHRPLFRFEMEPVDWILEGLSLGALLAFFGFVLYHYPALPDTIPTHFNTAGEPDDYGRKSTLWVLPLIGLVVYSILSFVVRIPEKFNFPVRITQRNARAQYLLSIRLIRYLKLAVVLIFFYIGYSTISIARHTSQTMGLWFLPVLIIILMVPVGIYFLLAFRNR